MHASMSNDIYQERYDAHLRLSTHVHTSHHLEVDWWWQRQENGFSCLVGIIKGVVWDSSNLCRWCHIKNRPLPGRCTWATKFFVLWRMGTGFVRRNRLTRYHRTEDGGGNLPRDSRPKRTAGTAVAIKPSIYEIYALALTCLLNYFRNNSCQTHKRPVVLKLHLKPDDTDQKTFFFLLFQTETCPSTSQH